MLLQYGVFFGLAIWIKPMYNMYAFELALVSRAAYIRKRPGPNHAKWIVKLVKYGVIQRKRIYYKECRKRTQKGSLFSCGKE